MGNDTIKSLSAAKLRSKAEERVKSKTADMRHSLSMEEMPRTVHELEVHQIELEMQNAELRQSREELEAALEKYTKLYDFASVGYLTLDRDGIIRDLNLTGAGFLGGSRSHLIGQRFGHFLAVIDCQAFTSFLGTVFTNQIKETCELTLLNKEKQPLIVQVEAVAAESGQECLVAFSDITERKLTYEKLRKSEQEFAEAQRLVQLGSWHWDSTADIITGSEEFYRIFGMNFSSYEEFVKLVYPDDRERVNNTFQDTLERQMPYDIYYRIVHPDETIRIIHAQGRRIIDGAGNKIRMAGTAHDVTERRRV